jgi:hypothetical protein
MPAQSNASDRGNSDPKQALAWLESSLLAGDVSQQTHDAILKEVGVSMDAAADKPAAARRNDTPAKASSAETIAGLILGSPEFQRR